ncbi:MAG: thiamine-binding protein [Bacteroidales bacterium]|nr:thiamine-binding protein [Bacteroidales bacterium]
MNYQINAALQVLPKSDKTNTYDIIDKAIEVIKVSGLRYRVCPFETVLEGSYDEVMNIIKLVQLECFLAGADEIISNIKLQIRKSEDVSIEDKMKKYE